MSANTDMRSKLIDGILAFILPTVGMFGLIFMFRLAKLAGDAGYWVFAALVLPMSLWLLHRSLDEARSEVSRAWYAIWGGFCGWTFTELGHTLGFLSIEDWEGAFLFVLTVAVTALVWKRVPLGLRFWVAIFELNWFGHLVILLQKHLLGTDAALAAAFTVTGTVCGVALIGLAYWLFAKSTARIQRIWCGLAMWQMLVIVMFALRG